jgi:hypothetical protein
LFVLARADGDVPIMSYGSATGRLDRATLVNTGLMIDADGAIPETDVLGSRSYARWRHASRRRRWARRNGIDHLRIDLATIPRTPNNARQLPAYTPVTIHKGEH